MLFRRKLKLFDLEPKDISTNLKGKGCEKFEVRLLEFQKQILV